MARPSRRSRAHARRWTPVELAVAFALGGSLLAVVVPTFARELHSSRLVEPVDGLRRIGASAVGYALGRRAVEAFPPSAPETPPLPPRGRCDVDPPGTWDTQEWQALGFRPVPDGVPHCFAFSFNSADSPGRATFRAQAHGDLDGDGIPSTFEITGRAVDGEAGGPLVEPGMFIDSEVE